jgi:hypothetical protein
MSIYNSIKDHKNTYSKVFSAINDIKPIHGISDLVIEVYVEAVGGVILNNDGYVYTCKCKNNHIFTITCKNIHKWCLICNCMYNLAPLGVKNITNNYVNKQQHILVTCRQGHRFVAETSTMNCQVCFMLYRLRTKQANILYDLDNIYIDKNSLLRFKCCKLINNNGACCGKDFIIRKTMIEKNDSKIFNCSSSHRWVYKYGITNLIRLFELMYSCKFNDIIIQDPKIYRPTGYNARLGIAFIHMQDTGAIYVNDLYKYCVNNGIVLLIVPETCNSSYDIIRFIVTKMHNTPLGCPWEKIISNAGVEETIIRIRTVFKKNTQNGLLYPQLARIF